MNHSQSMSMTMGNITNSDPSTQAVPQITTPSRPMKGSAQDKRVAEMVKQLEDQEIKAKKDISFYEEAL